MFRNLFYIFVSLIWQELLQAATGSRKALIHSEMIHLCESFILVLTIFGCFKSLAGLNL